MSISGNLFCNLAKPFLGWSLIEKWVLTLDTTVLLRRLINWRGRGDLFNSAHEDNLQNNKTLFNSEVIC